MLFIDTETRSATPIARGTVPYTEDKHFNTLLVTWAINKSEVYEWEPMEQPMPKELKKALLDDTEQVVIQNSAFDRRVLKKSGIIDLPPRRIIDLMVMAYMHGLPGSLDKLSSIFKLGELGKKSTGKNLMRLFCIPDKGKSTDEEPFFYTKYDKYQEWLEFVDYAKFDIIAMREIFYRMPKVNYPNTIDHKLWEYDQLMADRGILIDVNFAEKAEELFLKAKKESKKRVNMLTEGEVNSSTEVAKLIDFIAKEYNVSIPNLKKDTVNALLKNDDLPEPVKLLLLERTAASQSTPAKYRAMLNIMDSNNRVHDTVQFAGASRTGRDAGRKLQVQNFKRPTMWNDLSGDELSKAIDEDIKIVCSGSGDLFFDDPIDVLSNLIRSAIIAPPGKQITVADLSNIEGRSLSWLANEDWKVDYFRDYDKGLIKYDNYVMAYARSFNTPPEEVTSAQRAIGKVQELGLGYGGGVAAYLTFAAVYRINLEELATAVAITADDKELYNYSLGDKYDWAVKNGYSAGLPRHIYAACEYLKVVWRRAHPKIVAFWENLENAFRSATLNPDVTILVDGTEGKIQFRRVKSWLYMKLPSGRCLVYLLPKVAEDGSISFMGADQKTGKYKRINTYGGKLSENAASGTARDVMFHAIPAIEEKGFEIIFRVHDELVTEVDKSKGLDHHDLAKLMATPHEWCKDLPLAACGFSSNRYRGKD